MAKRSNNEQTENGILSPEIRNLALTEAGQTEKGAGWFRTTRWSLVRASREVESTGGQEALELLCRAYWQPVFHYVVTRGVNPTEAADVTQDFFVKFLSLNSLRGADSGKGRFRSLILASVSHHLHNHWRAQRAAKRGGEGMHEELESVDLPGSEGRDNATAFDRVWARNVVALAYSGLEQEYQVSGRGDIFRQMAFLLWAEEETPAELGPALNMSPGGLKVALHRLRRRFGRHLAEQVEATLSEGESVREELRYLLSLLEDEPV